LFDFFEIWYDDALWDRDQSRKRLAERDASGGKSGNSHFLANAKKYEPYGELNMHMHVVRVH